MHRRNGRSVRPLILGMIVLGMVLAPSHRNVSAHAVPEKTDPPMDQAVPVMPSTIEVWFSEEVESDGTTLEVLAADGSRVDLDNAELDLQDPKRAHVTVGVHSGLDNGVYIVQWTSVSAIDGDKVSGSYRFTVDPGASPRALPQVVAQQAPVQPPAIDVDATSGNTGRSLFQYGIGVVGAVLATVALLALWFFRRPAHGRRWRDDVVDRL